METSLCVAETAATDAEVGNYPKLIKAKLELGRIVMAMVDCWLQSQQSFLNDDVPDGNDNWYDAHDLADADRSTRSTHRKHMPNNL